MNKVRVLLVDEDTTIVELLRLFLEQRGYIGRDLFRTVQFRKFGFIHRPEMPISVGLCSLDTLETGTDLSQPVLNRGATLSSAGSSF
jgi:hypothetical protein